MPLISSSIPNLVNGVSQQPPTLRLASQAEVQENGMSTVSQGLMKRPPTVHIKRIATTTSNSAFIHTINRDSTERYVVVVASGDLQVFDLQGNQKTVNFPNGKGYLTSAAPSTDFRATTVADYTFIVNRSVVVQNSGTNYPARPFEAVIYVKLGVFGKTYTVTVSGVGTFTYTAPNGTGTGDNALIATDYIAHQLAIAMSGAGISVSQAGSVIYFTRPSDFTLTTEDGYGNTAMLSIKGKVQRFSDLPAKAVANDFTVEIVGDQSSQYDDYWVRFDNTSSNGVWRETRAPGIRTGLNGATMPWGLIRESDGTFTFKPLTWVNRMVGDDSSNPMPSFVGKAVTDVFFYRNRLGFLSDENVIMSEAGQYFNFFLTTVTDLLDSDPIDVAASNTKVSKLNFAVPFNKELLLFSSQTQFMLESGDLLTPRTVAIKPVTEFECSTDAEPVGIGRNIYFAVPRSAYEGFREFYVVDSTDANDASDVTSHIPKYLPKGIFKIAPALNEDFFAALTNGERNSIYTYKFYWNNNEKLQSAWSKWVFPSTDVVLNVEFIESDMYLVVNRPTGLYLETLGIALGVVGQNEPYLVHLDRKRYIDKSSLTYSAPYTLINLGADGWAPTDGDYLAVVPNGQAQKAGKLYPVIWDGTNAKVLGNVTGSDLVIGRKYQFRYVFSPLMVRSQNGQGQKADTVGRLQVRSMQINYADSGYFQSRVTPFGRDPYTYTFTGKTLGVPSATIGAIGIETGSFSFPVQSQNTTVTIELLSDNPMPCSFLSADWEGYYVRRSQAV